MAQTYSEPPLSISVTEMTALRRSEAMFRLALEAAPVPVALTRLSDSTLVFANQAVADTFNRGEPPVGLATSWYENPDDRLAMIGKLRADGVVRNYPLRMRTSSGEIGDFLMNMRPIVVEGVGMLCTFVLDVTDRKRAEDALRRRTEDMSMILENVSEGLLIVSGDGRVQAGRSSVVDAWLGNVHTGELVWSAFERVDPAAGAWLELGWEAVVENVLPLSLALEQLPRLVRVDGRMISLTVSPVGAYAEGEVPSRFLFVLRDITEQVERERTEATDRDVLTLLDRLVRDRAAVVDFLSEGDALVAGIRHGEDPIVLARDVHTLKGTAALAGVRAVAEACHRAEDDAASTGEWRAEPRAEIVAVWEAMAQRVRAFVVAGPEGRVDADAEDVRALEALVAAGASASEVLATVRAWSEPRLQSRLERYAGQAKSLARRLGKPEVHVHVDAGGLRLDVARLAAVWSSFAHAVRNAVDHGVQSDEERAAAGKPTPPRLELGAAREVRSDGSAWLRLWVEDDGPGVRWDAVRARAERLGLPAATEADLVDCLFADGLSTREVVTDTSGRGVGTGAWRAAVRDAGGDVRVTTSARGTRMECALPWPR